MKDKKNLVIAVLVFALIVSNLAVVTYANGGKMIEIFTGINLKVDGETFVPKDANGYAVDVFTYNGTTYLPLRALSEKFGKTVGWDGATKTVSIDSNASESKSINNNDTALDNNGEYLVDALQVPSSHDFEILSKTIEIDSKKYKDVIKNTSYVTFDNDKKYKRMTGIFYVPKDFDKNVIVKIKDGASYSSQILFTRTLSPGEQVDFDIKISDVDWITFEVLNEKHTCGSLVYACDVKVYK